MKFNFGLSQFSFIRLMTDEPAVKLNEMLSKPKSNEAKLFQAVISDSD